VEEELEMIFLIKMRKERYNKGKKKK